MTSQLTISADPSMPTIDGLIIQHRYIDIGNLKVHIAEVGKGEPVLMLHGWPQHWYMWREQMKYFAHQYHVIVPDIRGFGWSEATNTGYLKDNLAEDLHRLILALGYKQVKLMSHDWGGWIGFIASAKYPGLISKHFASNICPIWPKLSWKMIPATIQLGYMFRIAMPYFGPRMLMRNRNFLNYIFTRDNPGSKGWTEEEKNIYHDRIRQLDRAHASSKLYRDFLLKEYIPLGLGKYKRFHLKTPTYVLFGKKDFAIALSWLRGYENYADDIKIELVPDSGHFILSEKPNLVNERANMFFNS
jgi:pimeloyl-ACP methyl ester carboxylesterase